MIQCARRMSIKNILVAFGFIGGCMILILYMDQSKTLIQLKEEQSLMPLQNKIENKSTYKGMVHTRAFQSCVLNFKRVFFCVC